MPKVFDRQGRSYEVAAEEVPVLLATGAYFPTPNAHKEIAMMAQGSHLVTVYDISTGKPLSRRPVDAAELVRSGRYKYEGPQKTAPKTPAMPSATPPTTPPATPSASPSVSPNGAPEDLPQLSADNSKAEIVEVLGRYGVQYRSNMDKADLLELWNGYVAEHGNA